MTDTQMSNTVDAPLLQEGDAVAALSALAHKDRLAAFRLILTAMPNGLPSGQVAKDLAIAPTRMSFHLATLERAGLLTAQRHGRVVRYAIAPQTMRSLLHFLTQDCCNGDPALCQNLNPIPNR
ncbi:Helix-turn-helix domain protein [Pseudovibrio axinellae]|uniref:Helix-turn-helix domain protein n=1 Tax=Pseudovibrio axinellae TaxID=989403 RepID=A0A166ATT2_9HYPH|nr:helix-turn-helix domain-containing protein [Pseudovibrio axinellae]KZL21541.1 Helix-turn-helix domain protein [Pseudovibrio axinellae]SER08892.1 transcriptional regulator, ArsR family [Pseudovibrio axinellae]